MGETEAQRLRHLAMNKLRYWSDRDGHIKRRKNWDKASRMLARARRTAKEKGLDFSLSREDLIPLPTHCPIFHLELIYPFEGDGRRVDASASVNRIDNSIGYVPGNVIIVSWRANRIKSDASTEELRALYEFYRRKEEEDE